MDDAYNTQSVIAALQSENIVSVSSPDVLNVSVNRNLLEPCWPISDTVLQQLRYKLRNDIRSLSFYAAILIPRLALDRQMTNK